MSALVLAEEETDPPEHAGVAAGDSADARRSAPAATGLAACSYARETWPQVPDGRRRVIRETSEVARRVADGSYAPALKRDGAWW